MEQSVFEFETFKLFARNPRLGIIENSIENRSPPEPDIYCELEGQGGVAFELTRLIDPKLIKKTDLENKTKSLLTYFWKNDLNEKDSKIFRSKYSDALISFTFAGSLSERNRKKSLLKIFEKLIAQPEGTEGVLIQYDQDFLPEIEKIYIQRGFQGEPRFYIDGTFNWVTDTSIETLRKKCFKIYKTDNPIELLIHIDWDLFSPWGDDYWEQTITNIEEDFLKSPFRKLWVYDCTSEQILYEYEETQRIK